MASNVKISTGLKNALLGSQSIYEILRAGLIKVYSGTAPTDADTAIGAGNTLLCTISLASAVAKVAQIMRITPTAGTANAAEWRVTVNGDTVVFVDDGSPTPTEICTGLTNLLNVLAGGNITTPAGQVETAKCNGTFTVTNNTTTIDITSAVAGVPIDVTSTATGAGVGTGTLVTSTQAAHAYGLSLDYSGIASGVIEKPSGDVWSGAAGADGTAAFFRFVQDDDTGGLSTAQERIQGTISTANAPLIIKNINIYSGATVTVDTFQIET